MHLSYRHHLCKLLEEDNALYFPSNSKKLLHKQQSLISLRRLPYNWRTPGAYLITAVIVSIEYYYVGIVHFCATGMMYGVCVIINTFSYDLKNSLKEIDQVLAQCHMLSINRADSQAKAKKMLRDFVQFHCDATQLSALDIVTLVYSHHFYYCALNFCY